MKLKNLILPTLSVVMLSSCSLFHDDLEPCRQKVNVALEYTKNADGTDKFSELPHCFLVLLYDQEGKYIGQYDYDAATGMSVTLPAGDYHAIAYGGMQCDEADYLFNNGLAEGHDYTSLETYLSGTRAESAKDLHDHFHAAGDFTVRNVDTGEVNTRLSLTKNTNRFRVELLSSDGMPFAETDFDCFITADNAVTDHANAIVAQGTDVTYRPHASGSGVTENDATPYIWDEFTTGRLTADMDVRLHVVPTTGAGESLDIPLVDYLDNIRRRDLGDMSLQEYLDRRDRWTVQITVEPDRERYVVVSVKINDWNVVISGFDF